MKQLQLYNVFMRSVTGGSPVWAGVTLTQAHALTKRFGSYYRIVAV